MARNWKDQPEVLEDAQRLCRFYLSDPGVAVEVNKARGRYYLTMGTLFGSQTVSSMSLEDVLGMVDDVAQNPKKRNRKLPSGVRLEED